MLATESAMPPLHMEASSRTSAVAPMLPRRVVLFPFVLISPVLLLSQSSHIKAGECSTGDNRRLASDAREGVDDRNDNAVVKLTGSAVAGKVFDFVSKVVGEVGTEVKNTVLHGVSKLRTSEKYKKAKYLVSAPDIRTELVNSRLQRWGLESLRFVYVYSCLSPHARAALLKNASEEIPQFGKFYRKYVHLGESPDIDRCYKAVLALRAMLESITGKIRMQSKLQGPRMMAPHTNLVTVGLSPPTLAARTYGLEETDQRNFAEGTGAGEPTDSETRRLTQLLQLVVKQLPRILFYYIHPFSNSNVLADELALYLRKMLPAVKHVFVLAWRLNSVLPASSALANKRMMADYLNDVLDFEEGLRVAQEMQRGQVCTYNPENDYYYIPPPPAKVLQAPPLTDTL